MATDVVHAATEPPAWAYAIVATPPPAPAGAAGRSPSYLVRQMYDMQVGARHGLWADLMKPVVAKLTDEDFVSIAAYLSSRTP